VERWNLIRDRTTDALQNYVPYLLSCIPISRMQIEIIISYISPPRYSKCNITASIIFVGYVFEKVELLFFFNKFLHFPPLPYLSVFVLVRPIVIKTLMTTIYTELHFYCYIITRAWIIRIIIAMCMVVRVTKITGSRSDYWIITKKRTLTLIYTIYISPLHMH
jgi:hypothetical protein